ncbi:tetratricopeptide repeat protein [Halobacillus naozhouensis]|uniref:Tetratricopeptide repeat protein n=1 Tax=Halobacillus naozhouensis TaxID=554880 RepID=A0ABY8IUD5_9BACI|nr:tetratricopeptide repeat protein [Halobacillus naozhouensis]WFT73728.1 tetratricopeptide repeat protein [Halobacillus naozhouensis]
MTTSPNPAATNENTNIIPFLPTGNFYFSHGIHAFKKRRFDAAVKWLKKAIEISPDEPLYSCQLSVVYTEIGSYHAANQLLSEVIVQFGEQYPDCYYLMANNYAHLGLLSDAKKYAEKYLDYTGDGDFEEAAKQLLGMLNSIEEEEIEEDFAFDDEDELLIYQETAFYHLEHEEWGQALPVLQEMMELFPEFSLAKHKYAYALFQSGEHADAIELENAWLKKDHKNIHSLVNLACFYLAEQQEERALSLIEPLRNVYPMHEQQKLAIAETLARAGYYNEAVDRFRALRNKQVVRRRSYYKWFSISCYHTGNPSRALQLWEKGCKQFPKLSEEGGPWIRG